jgi:glycosyltransferase involved in cell wall biosynthesis
MSGDVSKPRFAWWPWSNARAQAQAKVYFIGPAATQRGGIASVLAAYAEAGLLQRWQVVHIVSAGEGSQLAKLRTAMSACLRFAWHLAQRRVGLAHVHTACYGSFWRKLPFFALTRCAGVPLIIHLHGGAFLDFYDNSSAVARRLIKWGLCASNTLITLSPLWQNRMRDLLAHPDVRVVPNPIPPMITDGLPETAEPSEKHFNLLFLGKVCEAKGLLDLLKALAMMGRDHPQLRLLVAGDGELDAARHWIAELGLAEQVSLLGWVGGATKDALWARAHLLVLPSHAEGVPMCILEAQSRGVPVLASNVGGIPDVVTHGVHGWLVPPHDPAAVAAALQHLLNDAPLRAAMAEAARRHCLAHHDLHRVVQLIDNIYQQYTGRHQP